MLYLKSLELCDLKKLEQEVEVFIGILDKSTMLKKDPEAEDLRQQAQDLLKQYAFDGAVSHDLLLYLLAGVLAVLKSDSIKWDITDLELKTDFLTKLLYEILKTEKINEEINKPFLTTKSFKNLSIITMKHFIKFLFPYQDFLHYKQAGCILPLELQPKQLFNKEVSTFFAVLLSWQQKGFLPFINLDMLNNVFDELKIDPSQISVILQYLKENNGELPELPDSVMQEKLIKFRKYFIYDVEYMAKTEKYLNGDVFTLILFFALNSKFSLQDFERILEFLKHDRLHIYGHLIYYEKLHELLEHFSPEVCFSLIDYLSWDSRDIYHFVPKAKEIQSLHDTILKNTGANTPYENEVVKKIFGLFMGGQVSKEVALQLSVPNLKPDQIPTCRRTRSGYAIQYSTDKPPQVVQLEIIKSQFKTTFTPDSVLKPNELSGENELSVFGIFPSTGTAKPFSTAWPEESSDEGEIPVSDSTEKAESPDSTPKSKKSLGKEDVSGTVVPLHAAWPEESSDEGEIPVSDSTEKAESPDSTPKSKKSLGKEDVSGTVVPLHAAWPEESSDEGEIPVSDSTEKAESPDSTPKSKKSLGKEDVSGTVVPLHAAWPEESSDGPTFNLGRVITGAYPKNRRIPRHDVEVLLKLIEYCTKTRLNTPEGTFSEGTFPKLYSELEIITPTPNGAFVEYVRGKVARTSAYSDENFLFRFIYILKDWILDIFYPLTREEVFPLKPSPKESISNVRVSVLFNEENEAYMEKLNSISFAKTTKECTHRHSVKNNLL